MGDYCHASPEHERDLEPNGVCLLAARGQWLDQYSSERAQESAHRHEARLFRRTSGPGAHRSRLAPTRAGRSDSVAGNGVNRPVLSADWKMNDVKRRPAAATKVTT